MRRYNKLQQLQQTQKPYCVKTIGIFLPLPHELNVKTVTLIRTFSDADLNYNMYKDVFTNF